MTSAAAAPRGGTALVPPLPVGPHRAAARLAVRRRGRPVRARRSPRRSPRTRPSSTRGSPTRAEGWTADRLGAVERNVLRIALQELDSGEVPERGRDRRGGRPREALRDRRGGQARERHPRPHLARARLTSYVDERRRRLQRAEELLAGSRRHARELERRPEDADGAIEILARALRAREGGRGGAPAREARGGGRRRCGAPDELRALVEDYLADLALTPELTAGSTSRCGTRSPAASACGRCSASRPARRRRGAETRAAGRGCASSSSTRSRSSTTTCPRSTTTTSAAGGRAPGLQYGEATAVLAGDALLAEAFRLALVVPDARGRARARAGDARDDRRPVPRPRRRRDDLARRCTG